MRFDRLLRTNAGSSVLLDMLRCHPMVFASMDNAVFRSEADAFPDRFNSSPEIASPHTDADDVFEHVADIRLADEEEEEVEEEDDEEDEEDLDDFDDEDL